MTFGRRVRDNRQRLGITGRALAEAAGMHQNTLIHIELNDTVTDIDRAARISDALGVSLDALCGLVKCGECGAQHLDSGAHVCEDDEAP